MRRDTIARIFLDCAKTLAQQDWIGIRNGETSDTESKAKEKRL